MIAPPKAWLQGRIFYAAVPARAMREPTRARRAPYNSTFVTARLALPMEAERINQIANALTDLKTRTAELRRYL
jgi:hypothetical protein